MPFDGTATKEGYIDSDGSVVKYEDPYVVTEDEYNIATELEARIIDVRQDIDKDFLVLAQLLDMFESNNGHIARGYPSFRAWVSSPEIDLSYRVAHDLLRIVREVLPILGEREEIPSVSKLRELLPLLADEQGEEKFLDTFDRTQNTTVRDTREIVKEVRGQPTAIEQEHPAIFRAAVTRGEVFHRVVVTCVTGTDQYRVGELQIKPAHYARFEQRFGAFVEFTDV